MGIRLVIIGLVVALGLTALSAIAAERRVHPLGHLNSSSLPPGPADAHPAR